MRIPKVGESVEYTSRSWERSWATITRVHKGLEPLIDLKTVDGIRKWIAHSAKDVPNTWRFVGEFEMAPGPDDPEYEDALRTLYAPYVPQVAA